jgi:aryl-alcohol dehydrogenase
MRTSAAIAHAPHTPLLIEEVDLEEPRPDEVLVRVVAAGICHTDLIIRDGWFPTKLPAVLGHEGSGVVEAVGANVDGFAPGDHVLMSFNSCGRCTHCLRGAPAYCMNFWAYNFAATRPDGTRAIRLNSEEIGSHFFGQSAFAEHCLATARNLVKVASDIDLEKSAPLGCGIQTGAGAVLNTLRPPAGGAIAVFGAGAVGLSAVMAAHLSGCSVIAAIDRVPARLSLARELGATHTFDSADAATAKSLRELTAGGVDFAIEATGVPGVLRAAMDSLATGGTCALIGAAASRTTAEIDISTLLFGRKLIGIIEGDSVPQLFIPALLDLNVRGLFPFERLVSVFDFNDINAAIAGAESGALVKPVVRMRHGFGLLNRGRSPR